MAEEKKIKHNTAILESDTHRQDLTDILERKSARVFQLLLLPTCYTTSSCTFVLEQIYARRK